VPLNSDMSQSLDLTDLLRSYGLYWTSLQPTRGLNCLDSVATNCARSELHTSVLNPVVADHLAVVSDLQAPRLSDCIVKKPDIQFTK
jgi:hypothetical protein